MVSNVTDVVGKDQEDFIKLHEQPLCITYSYNNKMSMLLKQVLDNAG